MQDFIEKIKVQDRKTVQMCLPKVYKLSLSIPSVAIYQTYLWDQGQNVTNEDSTVNETQRSWWNIIYHCQAHIANIYTHHCLKS